MSKARIIENNLVFKGTLNGNSIFFRQRGFELLIDDIKVIGVKFGMFLDDEYAIIIIISKINEKYFLYTDDIERKTVEELDIRFGIDLSSATSEYFGHEVDQFKSKILYPIVFTGKPIFKDKNVLTSLYLLLGKLFLRLHYADGLLSKDVKDLS
ncbi:hypothetical protein GCM10009430_41040 [Aquimarina litoralis]|uniref:DUF1854 domain-containing protein n=1 Tax=Aquimarina litoralis TaxID=584605 RepID=A0ABN1J6P0_9FLAO